MNVNCKYYIVQKGASLNPIVPLTSGLYHGEIIYGGTSWIEDDCPDTFSEFIFPFPLCDDFSLVDSVET